MCDSDLQPTPVAGQSLKSDQQIAIDRYLTTHNCLLYTNTFVFPLALLLLESNAMHSCLSSPYFDSEDRSVSDPFSPVIPGILISIQRCGNSTVQLTVLCMSASLN
ncbi:Hypothetical predicted protein [Pelobates cultripes]|uniref:Uncharacterized protein n=1 Tax=Pelobates cultripes TaxID=61616 RepID=A0AAD1TI81_PELCU|nr:Hypothetical predicted protein [Pelobates cultripes]